MRETVDRQTMHILDSDHKSGGHMTEAEASKLARESVERCVKKGIAK